MLLAALVLLTLVMGNVPVVQRLPVGVGRGWGWGLIHNTLHDYG